MRFIGVLTVCVLVAVQSASALEKVYYNLYEAPLLFAKFVQDYHKVYQSYDDETLHYAAFVLNLDNINKKNAVPGSATFGINAFADLTDDEFVKHHTGLLPYPPKRLDVLG